MSGASKSERCAKTHIPLPAQDDDRGKVDPAALSPSKLLTVSLKLSAASQSTSSNVLAISAASHQDSTPTLSILRLPFLYFNWLGLQNRIDCLFGAKASHHLLRHAIVCVLSKAETGDKGNNVL